MAFGKLDLRVGAARRVDVADQGQDRVVVRGEGELRLATLGELAILRDNASDPLQLSPEEDRLIFLGEVAVLALQLGEPRVLLDPDRVAPGEVEPHLQVADVRGRELRIHRP